MADRAQGLPAGADDHHRAGGGLRPGRGAAVLPRVDRRARGEGEADRPHVAARHLRRGVRRHRERHHLRRRRRDGQLPRRSRQYRGGVGRPDANLDFYGEGGDLGGAADLKLGYNLQGWASTQQLLRRLGDSNNSVGLRWIWLDLDARFAGDQPLPAFLPQSRTVRSSGVGPVLEHDSRDNFFTPSRGWYANLEALFYSPDIGSDEKYEIYRARVFGYLPLGKEFVLGGRVDARSSSGDVPFYQLPFVDLRGIPVQRYQDQNTGALEAELRWNVTPRWALVGFTGVGRAWGSSSNFSDAEDVSSVGVGFRYLVARRLGIYMGLDVAKGPEDTAVYIQMGSAWR
jgi:hypothetical protein